MVSRVRVIYRGQVQGVGFRATCRSIAAAFPVTGFVRNEADGSVLLEAQGTDSEVDRFLMRVAGDLVSRIENSSREEITPQGESTSFRIVY